jgi:hypothetical protein
MSLTRFPPQLCNELATYSPFRHTWASAFPVVSILLVALAEIKSPKHIAQGHQRSFSCRGTNISPRGSLISTRSRSYSPLVNHSMNGFLRPGNSSASHRMRRSYPPDGCSYMPMTRPRVPCGMPRTSRWAMITVPILALASNSRNVGKRTMCFASLHLVLTAHAPSGRAPSPQGSPARQAGPRRKTPSSTSICQMGVPGVTAGKFTVSHNRFIIK